MCPDLSYNPKTIKGAIVAYISDSKEPKRYQKTKAFVFQYNPDTLVRTLAYPDHPTDNQENRYMSEGPVELISLTLELDASDQLEHLDQHHHFVENGLHPSLITLESMMCQESNVGNRNEKPLTLFHWGPRRNIPVRLISLKICEEAFDQDLNPIRARIDLSMRVLNYSDFREGSLGYYACMKYLDQRNSLAELYAQNFLESDFSDSVGRSTFFEMKPLVDMKEEK